MSAVPLAEATAPPERRGIARDADIPVEARQRVVARPS